MRLASLALPVAALLAAAPALAGSGPDARTVVEHIFDVSDTDDSGSLTAPEYAAAGLARYGVSFEASDLDGDGETSFAEYLELYERHHAPKAGSEI